jgi:hypothetical protein
MQLIAILTLLFRSVDAKPLVLACKKQMPVGQRGSFLQDIGRFAEVVDVSPDHEATLCLAGAISADIKRRSGRKPVCTVQARALDLDGMHQGRGRASILTAGDFAAALDALEEGRSAVSASSPSKTY